MVTEELLKYIQSQKQQGKNDEYIKDSLLKSGWPEPDVNQAIFPQPQPNLQSIISTTQEEKPKIIKTISILFFAAAILYVMSTASFVGIIVIIDRAMGSADSSFSFLRYFPTFGVVPILFSLVTLTYFYVSLKIRNGSKFSYWLGISSLLAIPVPVDYIGQILMASFINLASSGSKTTGANIPTLPINPTSLKFGLLPLLILILLIISFKKFKFSNNPISKKAKVFLVSVTLLLVLPTISIMGLKFLEARDTDFGYTKAKAHVTYRLYKPSPLPNGLVNTTKFVVGKELAGKQNAVQVAYDVPFTKLIEKGTSKLVILKQVGIEPGFNLRDFVSATKDLTSFDQISVNLTANQEAYLAQKNNGHYDLKILSFVTPDDVLITLTTPNATKEELIQLANSLN